MISGAGWACAAHLKLTDSPSRTSRSEDDSSSINLGGTWTGRHGCEESETNKLSSPEKSNQLVYNIPTICKNAACDNIGDVFTWHMYSPLSSSCTSRMCK